MKTQRKKHSRLWVYLLYLGLVTSLILSVTLARYVSTAGGTGTATVAAMAGGGEPIQMTLTQMAPGGTSSLKFKVVNFSGDAVSEVALDYGIKVDTTGNLPLKFVLTAEKAAGTEDLGTTVTVGETGEILKGINSQILGDGTFPLAEKRQEHTYTLTVTWPAEKTDANYASQADAGYADEIDVVTVTVRARQRLSGEG